MRFGAIDEVRMVEGDGLPSPSPFLPPTGNPSSSTPPASTMPMCRICHEEDKPTSMESPCACSGTLKFAHRECIQRWCDEKGSTLCEICLQVFEPGYTAAPKKAQQLAGGSVTVTIRESLEVLPRLNYEPQSPRPPGADPGFVECSTATQRNASCCRFAVLTFAIILLVKHLTEVLSDGADNYAFSLLTVFLLRASGIFVPFFLIMCLISAIQHGQQQYQLQQLQRRNDSSSHGVEEDEQQQQQHTVQIHTR